MLRICTHGHITGYRLCSFCHAVTTPITPQRGPDVALNKKYKRRISQAIREAGGTPVADLRSHYWMQAHTTRRKK